MRGERAIFYNQKSNITLRAPISIVLVAIFVFSLGAATVNNSSEPPALTLAVFLVYCFSKQRLPRAIFLYNPVLERLGPSGKSLSQGVGSKIPLCRTALAPPTLADLSRPQGLGEISLASLESRVHPHSQSGHRLLLPASDRENPFSDGAPPLQGESPSPLPRRAG